MAEGEIFRIRFEEPGRDHKHKADGENENVSHINSGSGGTEILRKTEILQKTEILHKTEILQTDERIQNDDSTELIDNKDDR